MNEPLKLSVGVTGHRDLVPEEVPGIRERLHAFFTDLAAQYPDLQLELISGLAEGADTVTAEVALEMSIPVVAVLPMEQSDYERDFASAEALTRFRRLVDASTVVTLSPENATPGPEVGMPHSHSGLP